MPTSQLFQNILYPTDFSKSSEAIASHVAGVASAFVARVRLLTVVSSLAEYHGASETYFAPLSDAATIGLEESRRAAEIEARKKIERLQSAYFDPARSSACIESGGVAESIVDHAKDINADLIMMSTRGLGAMRRFLIGPVTAKVLHDAACPVWTSPHPRELNSFQPYRHVVLAIDYRGWPPSLLTRAAEIADVFGGRLSVLSALPSRGHMGDEAVQNYSREVAAQLRDHVARLNIEAGVHVMEGEPGEVVRYFAEQVEDADLIVTGRGHLDESMGHLRTHAYEIIWNAPCPVVTMRG